MFIPMSVECRVCDDLAKLPCRTLAVRELTVGAIVDSANDISINNLTPYEKVRHRSYHLPVFEHPHSLGPPLECW